MMRMMRMRRGVAILNFCSSSSSSSRRSQARLTCRMIRADFRSRNLKVRVAVAAADAVLASVPFGAFLEDSVKAPRRPKVVVALVLMVLLLLLLLVLRLLKVVGVVVSGALLGRRPEERGVLLLPRVTVTSRAHVVIMGVHYLGGR